MLNGETAGPAYFCGIVFTFLVSKFSVLLHAFLEKYYSLVATLYIYIFLYIYFFQHRGILTFTPLRVTG